MAAKMHGIDISKWQGKVGFNPKNVPADFIIVRATYGTHVIDGYLKFFAGVTLNMGKPLGLYHFATGEGGAVKEAEYFLAQAKPYIGKALLILDWEGAVMQNGPTYAKEYCDCIYNNTGVIPILYTGTSAPTQYNWKDFLGAGYKYLWGAEYNKNQEFRGYNPSPANKHLPTNGFTEIIRQYSSNTYLPGYDGRLDANEAYIDKYQWEKLCRRTASKKPATYKPTEKLPNSAIALKIINKEDGWGIKGQERIDKLKSEGYDPKAVQDIINQIMPDIQEGKEYYSVLPGDVLSRIAVKFKLSMAQILELNPEITNPNIIKPGQLIRVK